MRSSHITMRLIAQSLDSGRSTLAGRMWMRFRFVCMFRNGGTSIDCRHPWQHSLPGIRLSSNMFSGSRSGNSGIWAIPISVRQSGQVVALQACSKRFLRSKRAIPVPQLNFVDVMFELVVSPLFVAYLANDGLAIARIQLQDQAWQEISLVRSVLDSRLAWAPSFPLPAVARNTITIGPRHIAIAGMLPLASDFLLQQSGVEVS